MDHKIIYATHIAFVAPLLMYPFIMNYYTKKKNNYENYFILLFIIGMVVFLYHGYKLRKII
jgi:hypothetical protein